MAKLPGLFKRAGTYYLRVVVPKDLRSIYAGQSKLITSLRTAAATEAKALGAQRRAEALAAFSRHRQPAPVHTLLGGVAAPALPSHAAQPPSAPAYPPQTRAPVGLRELHTRWAASRNRSQDSKAACLRALELFEQCAGRLALQEITRRHGDTFRAWLLEPARATTSKTARDRLTWMKSLLKYAAQDLELLSRQPWEGLDIEVAATPKRRPWTHEELKVFFHRPLFESGELPTERNAGRHAAYWIPILGLYTGARVGELAQLRVQDIIFDQVPHLVITDASEGQRVKSAAGHRRVPLHSEVLRLGFAEYVRTLDAAPQTPLWPALPLREGKPGGFFSQWFGEERRRAGLTGAYPPKRVTGLALHELTGRTYRPSAFKGGLESACFRALQKAGFTIAPKESASATDVAYTLREVLRLQTQYSSQNTPAMERRGTLIRSEIPRKIRSELSRFEPIFSTRGYSFAVEGSDGMGRKVESTWVRLYDPEMSPSATSGWYVVVHFDRRGEHVFATLGCGATRFHAGSFVGLPTNDLDARVAWARALPATPGFNPTLFSDGISLHGNELSALFERATAYSRSIPAPAITASGFYSALESLARRLMDVYDAQRAGQDPALWDFQPTTYRAVRKATE